jgi:hypothetical protein
MILTDRPVFNRSVSFVVVLTPVRGVDCGVML